MNERTYLIGKSILIISPEPWGAIFVSKHHYAIELSKRGNKVFFLNPPNLTLNTRVKVSASKEYQNLYIIDYKPLFRGLQYLPFFISQLIEKIQFKLFERKIDTKFNIVWNFENSRFYNFKYLPKGVLGVYHQVDFNQDFHPNIAASTADIVFCTTDFIKDKLSKKSKSVFKINHGFSGYLGKISKNILEQGDYAFKKEKKVKAYYIGNLDIPYLNIDLLASLIKKSPDVDFIFVGPYSYSKTFYKEIGSYQNVILKGSVKSSDIPKLLGDADILLLIYKAEEFKEQLANPHKLMEYLSAGKITVATYTDEYKYYRHLLLMADKLQDIPQLFSDAKKKLQYYNDPVRMKERILFALDNTYKKQVDKIEELIVNNERNK